MSESKCTTKYVDDMTALSEARADSRSIDQKTRNFRVHLSIARSLTAEDASVLVQESDSLLALLTAENVALKAEVENLRARCERSDEEANERKDELDISAATVATYKCKISDLRQELRRVQAEAGNAEQQKEKPGRKQLQNSACQVVASSALERDLQS